MIEILTRCKIFHYCNADKSGASSRLRNEWSSIFSDYLYNSIKTKCKLPFTSFKKAQSWKVSLSLLRNSLTIRPNQEIDLSGTKNAFNLIRRLNLSDIELPSRGYLAFLLRVKVVQSVDLKRFESYFTEQDDVELV